MNLIELAPNPSFKLNPQEMEAIHLKYIGKEYPEIARKIGYSESSVKKWFMKGGRLAEVYEAYQTKQMKDAEDVTQRAIEQAKMVVPDAMKKVIEIAQDSDQKDCLRANEKILDLAGVTADENLRRYFQKLSFEEALKRIDSLFDALYGKSLMAWRDATNGRLDEKLDGLSTEELRNLAKSSS